MNSSLHTGVVVGSDRSQEWLLSWFYSHFRQHNADVPIAFADFGMSDEARQWCRERGELYDVPLEGLEQKPFLYEGQWWMERYLDTGQLEAQQGALFRKPFALQNSPFQRTLWLDLDCQVRGDLHPLFSLPLNEEKLAATPAGSGIAVQNHTTHLIFLVPKYNTGVILVEKGAFLLKQWAEMVTGTVSFSTDEGSLSFLISQKQTSIVDIGYETHWPVSNWGEKEEALIYHFLGKHGKEQIRQLIRQSNCVQRPPLSRSVERDDSARAPERLFQNGW